MSGPAVRRARLDDAAAINAIYNPFVRDTAITFDVEEYDEARRRAWLKEKAASPRWPVFVAEQQGAVCGFANAAAFDPRGAYETSVKVSVFTAPEARGAGVGRALYEALFAALAGADAHRAYALVTSPNPASVRLHEAVGFRRVCVLNEVGRKFGRYHDVIWFEKRL